MFVPQDLWVGTAELNISDEPTHLFVLLTLSIRGLRQVQDRQEKERSPVNHRKDRV